MFFVLFIANSGISNIRDYLSNSIDNLSYLVLNLKYKIVACCDLVKLCLYSYDIHSELLILLLQIMLASKISKGNIREVTSYIRDFC